jgi:non-lysosomal glucosylceramidase
MTRGAHSPRSHVQIGSWAEAARNPWNERECGDHYARALASYGLLQAYAGLHIDRSRGRLELAPRVERDRFATFFAVEGAWGGLALDGAALTVELGAGELTIGELVVDGRLAPLSAPVTVRAGRPARIELGGA